MFVTFIYSDRAKNKSALKESILQKLTLLILPDISRVTELRMLINASWTVVSVEMAAYLLW